MISVPMDIGSHLHAYEGVAPQSAAASATVNGSSIDRSACLSGVLVLDVGAISGAPTGTAITAKLQDSADGSTFADFAPNTGAASVVATGSGVKSVNVNLLGARQYVRAVVTSALTGGTTPTAMVQATVVLGGAINEPA